MDGSRPAELVCGALDAPAIRRNRSRVALFRPSQGSDPAGATPPQDHPNYAEDRVFLSGHAPTPWCKLG
ncbi:MAG: hypothetical protein K0S65_4223 [Labilithrix sp.]|nr:hypothetical protein [Labilithrix sp.]